MAFSSNLLSSMKKTFSSSSGSSKVISAKKSSGNNITTDLRIIAKNFLVLPNIARDISVARRNFDILVQKEGGKPAKSADKFFMREGEKERALESERERGRRKVQAVPTPKKQDERGIISKVIGAIVAGILVAIVGVFALGDIIASFFKSIGETLSDAVDFFKGFAKRFAAGAKEIFDKIFESIKTFYEETIQPIVDEIKSFFNKIINVVVDFLRPITDWISSKFNSIVEFLQPVFTVLGNIFNKITEKIQSLRNTYNSMVNKVKGVLTGDKDKKEKPVDDSAEKKKFERQQAEAERQETERVRKLEKEKQYTGDDEIVRARLGLPSKTETMRREEAKKREDVEKGKPTLAEAPTPTPPPSPTPAPSIPSAPSPTKAEPGAAPTGPTAIPTGSAAEQIITELNNAGISSKRAQANILAQVAKESNFKPINENLDKWTAATLFRLYGPPGASYENKGKPDAVPPHKNKVRFPTWESAIELAKKGAEAIGDVVYGGRMGNQQAGDGYKYRGRGYIQLTGKDAYEKLGKALGIDLVSDPDKVNDPSIAAKIVPAFFLKFKGKRPEDLEDINKVNKLVGAADPKSVTARVSLASSFEAKLASGESIGSSSSQVASGQRQQAKPQTPVIVNAPTNNNTVINKTQTASAPKKDTASNLTAAAA
jgi:predicted chitinase